MDSPVFTLLSEWKPGDIARLKTDVFRDRAQANEEFKRRLAIIREKNKKEDTRLEAHAELKAFRNETGRARHRRCCYGRRPDAFVPRARGLEWHDRPVH